MRSEFRKQSIAIYHPSAVLRMPHEQLANEKRAAIVADMREAWLLARD